MAQKFAHLGLLVALMYSLYIRIGSIHTQRSSFFFSETPAVVAACQMLVVMHMEVVMHLEVEAREVGEEVGEEIAVARGEIAVGRRGRRERAV